jgi:hypothetical protein
MSESDAEGMVAVQLTGTTAARLALFCKRAIMERVEPFAADLREAGKMLLALNELGAALEEEGYAPR